MTRLETLISLKLANSYLNKVQNFYKYIIISNQNMLVPRKIFHAIICRHRYLLWSECIKHSTTSIVSACFDSPMLWHLHPWFNHRNSWIYNTQLVWCNKIRFLKNIQKSNILMIMMLEAKRAQSYTYKRCKRFSDSHVFFPFRLFILSRIRKNCPLSITHITNHPTRILANHYQSFTLRPCLDV